MPSGSAKIVLDADATKAVAAAKKTGDAFKQATREAAGLGAQINTYGEKLAKTVVGVGAVARAIAAVAQEVVNVQRAAADASRKTGGSALDAASAGSRLGLTGQDSQALTTPGGGHTREEMIGLLNSLAGSKDHNGNRMQFDRKTVFQAAIAFRGGQLDSDEVVDAAKNGSVGDLLKTSAQRNELIGSDARFEQAVRQEEQSAAEQALQIRAGRNGARTRLAQSARDLRNARDPITGGFQNIVGSAFGADNIIEASDIGIIGHKLDAQTTLMRAQADRPTLAPSPDKQ